MLTLPIQKQTQQQQLVGILFFDEKVSPKLFYRANLLDRFYNQEVCNPEMKALTHYIWRHGTTSGQSFCQSALVKLKRVTNP